MTSTANPSQPQTQLRALLPKVEGGILTNIQVLTCQGLSSYPSGHPRCPLLPPHWWSLRKGRPTGPHTQEAKSPEAGQSFSLDGKPSPLLTMGSTALP